MCTVDPFDTKSGFASRDPAIFYFDLLHDNPDMGGVVQFSSVLLEALKRRFGRRLVPASALRRQPAARSSMEAFEQEDALANLLAAQKPDATFLFPHFYSPLRSRGPGQRVINIVHDVQFKSCPQFYRAADLQALDIAHRETCARADDILFVSEASRDDFARHFGMPRRHTVIGAPVEAERGAFAFGGAPYLLATSHNSHHPHKNLRGLFDLFARIAEKIPDLQLRMTGFGAETVAAEVQCLPRRLAQRVHHHGFVTRATLDALYAGAYAFVSLSRFEGFNLSAAEGAVHGTPLLLSDLPAHRELFGELALFITPATSDESILAHIESRRSHPKDWTRLASCTPDAVAHAVAGRIEGLRQRRVADRKRGVGAAGRLRTLLLSSLAGSVLLTGPSFAQTVLTTGGASGDGASGGNYNQDGTNAPGGGISSGGGGGPGGGSSTAGGTATARGAAGGNGGASGLVDGPSTTTNSYTGQGGTASTTGTDSGGGGGAGGYGQIFTGPSAITNGFTQTGGAGGDGGSFPSNNRLAGQGGGGGGGLLLMEGGTVTNTDSGQLLGGRGGEGGSGGNGGAGLETSSYRAVITNSGVITGGAGGLAYDGVSTPPGTPGTGGAGVALIGDGAVNNINNGKITGGAGGTSGAVNSTGANYTGFGGNGGSGIDLYEGGTISNGFASTITGGAGGIGVPGTTPYGGGTPYYATNGGNGGAGINLIGGALTFSSPNLGQITGGAGGAGGGESKVNGAGGNGGDAILVVGSSNGTTISNGGSGILQGGRGGNAGNTSTLVQYAGASGGNGGMGVNASTTTTLLSFSNAAGGRISGGDGGNGGASRLARDSGVGGTGGAGAVFGTVPSFTNAGYINGGNGGNGGYADFLGTAADGGAGGVGVQFLAPGVTVVNTGGTIIGGNGGNGGNGFLSATGIDGNPGVGGIGVIGADLTIENTGGTISGGLDGSGTYRNYAIKLTGGTNYVGTGGTISGGIYVGGGASFQPALPDTTPGTALIIGSPLYFESGTSYNIRVTPTASDRVIANGTDGVATLNGATVNATFANGTYQVRQYTILTAAAGVSGTFSALTFSQDFAFLTPTLSYDTNNVYLNVAPTNPIVVTNPTTGLPIINPVTGQPIVVPDYRPAAITYNQTAVASGLTQAGIQNDGRGPILNALNQLSAAQARNAFDNLSGEGITAAQNVAFRSTQLFTSSIFDETTFYSGATNSVTLCADLLYRHVLTGRPNQNSCEPVRELADLPARSFQPGPAPAPNRTWRAWATGWGGTEHIAGNAFPIGSATQNNSLYGGSLGVDYQLLPNYLVGVALGGSNGDFSVDQRGTYGTTTGGHIAIYDLYELGNWYGASSSSFSYFGNRTTRYVTGFGNLGSETERGDFDSHEYRTRLEIGRHFASLPTLASFGGVTPFVALELAELRSNGFTEYTQRGAGNFRLNVSGQSLTSVPGFVGLRFQRATAIGNGIIISPTLQVAYVHEFAPYRSQIGTIADLPGSSFLVNGARPARNAAQVKAGAEMAIGAHSVIFANFDGEFSGVNQLYAGKGGFRYVW